MIKANTSAVISAIEAHQASLAAMEAHDGPDGPAYDTAGIVTLAKNRPFSADLTPTRKVLND
jgi:hypothetical protein